VCGVACQKDVPGSEGRGHRRVAAPRPHVENLDGTCFAAERRGDARARLVGAGGLGVGQRVGHPPQVFPIERPKDHATRVEQVILHGRGVRDALAQSGQAHKGALPARPRARGRAQRFDAEPLADRRARAVAGH
jgi:hypothetical protein